MNLLGARAPGTLGEAMDVYNRHIPGLRDWSCRFRDCGRGEEMDFVGGEEKGTCGIVQRSNPPNPWVPKQPEMDERKP